MRTKFKFSLILMIMISFATQILSLLKSSIVASNFGTGVSMDAYNLANNIVTFAFSFVASGISTIIIPEYANKRNKKSVDTFITMIYGIMIIVVISMIVLRVKLVGLFGNQDEMVTNIVANILIVLLLAQYLLSITNITVAYFQCEGLYNIPKIISLITQLCVIIALVFVKGINIIQYTQIIALGFFINFVLDIFIAFKLGWRFKPALLFNEETKKMFSRFIPIVISTGVYSLTLMIDTTLSSFLETGKLSVLSYSSQISSMLNTILVGNLTIYLYPKISKEIKKEGYQRKFWRSTSVLHAIVCLVSAVFLTVGYNAVIFLFQRGKFTSEDSKMVFTGASIYVVGQQISIIRSIIYRYFYALGDTKTPGINSIEVSIMNVAFSLILVNVIGFYGIIVGTVLASVVSLLMILFRFGKIIGFEELPWSILGRYFKSFLIFAVTVTIVYLTKYTISISQNIISILFFGVETVIIYTLLSLIFNRKVLKRVIEL